MIETHAEMLQQFPAWLEARGLKHSDGAELLGITPQKLTYVLRGRVTEKDTPLLHAISMLLSDEARESKLKRAIERRQQLDAEAAERARELKRERENAKRQRQYEANRRAQKRQARRALVNSHVRSRNVTTISWRPWE